MRFRRLTTTTATLALALALLAGGTPAGAAPAPAQYVVQPGDTLYGIALNYGFRSWTPLYEANRDRISDPDSLVIGTVLTIPGGESELAPPATATNPARPAAGKGDGWRGYLYATAPYPAWQEAVILCESQGNPSAYNPRSGATGLAQFMPATARSFGIAYLGYPINPWDWRQSIDLMNAMFRDGLSYHWACA